MVSVFSGKKGLPVSVTLGQLAELVQGKVLGNGDLVVTDARILAEAQPGDITFLDHEKHLNQLHDSKALAAVVPPSVQANGKPVIQVADPLLAFVTIVRHFHHRPELPVHGIDPRAVVHPSARFGFQPSVYPLAVIGEGTTLGARCRIHSGAVIGRFCKIGADVTIHPNAVLYDETIVGDRAIIHANAVIGADGFGYRVHEGKHVKVPQLGCVEIGADVEIGACTTVDRGTFGATRIGAGSKLDNLVMIGHNCQVGKHNLLCSQTGIAGSCGTGDYVVMAGQVGITDHVHIGAGTIIGAKAGVSNDIPAGERWFGIPATPIGEQKRIMMTIRKLPEMRKTLGRIQKHLGLEDDAA